MSGHARKNVIALVAGVFFLLFLEGILALGGVAPLAQGDAPGFTGRSRLFVPTGDGRYELNPKLEAYFNQQSFDFPKPEKRFRILTLGGSTTYGRPWLGRTAFAAWLRQLLERYCPGLEVDTINAGGISYASYRLEKLVPELLEYQPDLVVVYAGHNEFLEKRTFEKQISEPQAIFALRRLLHRSRLYTLVYRGVEKLRPDERSSGDRTFLGEGVDAVLEHIGGPELYHRDDEFRREVLSQYRSSLQSILDGFADKGVPVVVCTLPVNLSGVSPFKSEHRPGLSAEDLQTWQRLWQDASVREQAGDWSGALGRLDEALKIDARYAELHFRRGVLLERLGRIAEAYHAYDRARQEDIIPLRALDEINDIIRQLAEKPGVYLADVERFFLRISPGGIPGRNLFADHVHPTLEGQQIIAWVVLNAATRAGLVPMSEQVWQQNMPDARAYLADQLLKLPESYVARGVWGVGRLYYWAGKYAEAEPALRQAWQTVHDEPEIPRQLGNLALWRGQPDEALAFFQQALQLQDDPWARFGMVQALLMQERYREATDLLNRDDWPDKLRYQLDLARCRVLFGLGRAQEARGLLAKLDRYQGDVPSIEKELARLAVLAGDWSLARRHYRRGLELEKYPAPDTETERWIKNVLEQAR